MRKYFELQIQRFDEDFCPDMDFLQNLLKKPPIHVLPNWYAIPRTSDNIFDSLIEKNLKTPMLFQRYIMELNFGEPILQNIIQDVHKAKNLEVKASAIRKKYNITKELFEEYMLHLEFNFVCCLSYRKNGDEWEELVTPFYEWKEYLLFLQNTETPSISKEQVTQKGSSEFSFVQDLSILLTAAKKERIPLEVTQEGLTLPQQPFLQSLLPFFADLSPDETIYKPYLHHLLTKLSLIRLVDLTKGTIQVLDAAVDWLELRLDNKALYLYRHPLNRLADESYTEKAAREIEKNLVRVLEKDWVLFEDFLQGVYAEINENCAVMLKKTGKTWKYSIPNYAPLEKKLIRSIVLEWLFEAGLIQTGSAQGLDCFRVTTLGRTLFAR